MTITLDKVEGMNIPRKTPVEVTLEDPEGYKELGYFQGVKDSPFPKILYTKRTGYNSDEAIFGWVLSNVRTVKILTYK